MWYPALVLFCPEDGGCYYFECPKIAWVGSKLWVAHAGRVTIISRNVTGKVDTDAGDTGCTDADAGDTGYTDAGESTNAGDEGTDAGEEGTDAGEGWEQLSNADTQSSGWAHCSQAASSGASSVISFSSASSSSTVWGRRRRHREELKAESLERLKRRDRDH
jgi:hypothetical protein